MVTKDKNQGFWSVAIGDECGMDNQKDNAIAIGNSAGQYNQKDYTVALGVNAGCTGQGQLAIAIGNSAGSLNQGDMSIAIGNQAGKTSQSPFSIVINATGSPLENNTSNTLKIAPIGIGAGSSTLKYNSLTKEITFDTAKTFVIDHPLDNRKHLVHGCLEGPEGGVYYRGKAEITNNESTTIILPEYVDALATDFTVQLTQIHNGTKVNPSLQTSEVENGRFVVYGSNCKFFWLVHGKRCDIDVEPDKSTTVVKGSGPYRWI